MESPFNVVEVVSSHIALRTDRLRTLREQHGWSQRELARRCGVSDAQINKYESGQTDPSSTYLKLIAEQLNVSTDYLLGVTDDPQGHYGDGQLSDDEHAMLQIYRREGWPGVFRFGAERLAK